MSTQTQREITIYATRGGKMEKIMTDVTTWGELKPLVKKAGYDLSSLLAAESFTKHDLVNDLALLPVENFRLFLRPKQTKSGAEMSYKELRGAIKDILDGNEEAKEHFNQGKNYTTKGTEELRSLYNSYAYGGKKTSAPQPVKEVIKAKKAGKVKKDKSSKKGKKNKTKEVLEDLAQADKVTQRAVPVQEVEGLILQSIVDVLGKLPQTENISSAIEFLNEELFPSVKEEKQESEKLAREAREMEMGY